MKDKQYSPFLAVYASSSTSRGHHSSPWVWKVWYYRSELTIGIHRTDGPSEIEFSGSTYWNRVNNEE